MDTPGHRQPSLLARLDAADRALSARCLVPPGESGTRRVVMSVIRRLSQTGSYGVGWVVLFAVVVTALEGVVPAVVAAACVVGTLAANTIVKNLFRRPRPSVQAYDHVPSSYSMPSAHTSMAVVGAGIMTIVAPALWPLWWAWSALLAASRVMLGMHYVADVVVGALFGLVLLGAAAVPLMHWVL